MSKLNDIFDIQLDETTDAMTTDTPKEQPVKKERKKAELSDEKKAAMLERLRAGREKRAENLKKKKEPKEVKEVKETKETKKDVPKFDAEAEKLSFINMMAGKNRESNTDKYVRPKRKIQAPVPEVEKPKEVVKVEKQQVAEVPKVAQPPKVVISQPVPKPQPVIIRTFKKPIWA